ncbi:MAG TPA: hypothetical protein DHW82_08500 [Spirochaetia bacterium]|nr:MAG: hypothetical protein A2Y41_13155 [Spirochaetes bacterium GWB1_36_13]HCL57029.1 hypothetical protein [Spirochaetia bacterium]
MKKIVFIMNFFLVTVMFFGCGDSEKQADGKMKVFVSIAPQKFFAEKIGKDKISVSIMVGNNQNPHTYSPLPSQMLELEEAKLLFKIGVPFEKNWLEKVKNIYPALKIIDTSEGTVLRKTEQSVEISVHSEEEEDHEAGTPDPHVWLSPSIVSLQAENICKALSETDPANKAFYEANLKEFQGELKQLSMDIQKLFQDKKNKRFMVYHPVLGYFADEFGLQQLPIEIEGKNPTAKELTLLIDLAKKEKIKVIFVQIQFSRKEAAVLAGEIGGKVEEFDPLDENYLLNMKKIAEILSSGLE